MKFEPLDSFMQCHEGIHTGNSRDILFSDRCINKYCRPLYYGGGIGDIIQNYKSKTSGWYVDYRNELINKSEGYYASLRDERIFKYPKIYISRTGNPFKVFYDEDTYAAYLQTSYHTEKWKVTAGLRMEATHYHIYSEDKILQRDTTNSKNNIYLFPSLSIVYSICEGQSFMLSYSKRVIRPNYADLNPFVYIFDDYTLESGNTDLRPAFSHNLELSLVNQKFGQITGFLSLMDDALVKGFAIDENECVRTFRRNFADYLSTGLRYQSMFNITNRWNASVFAACVYNRYKWREDGAECTNSRLTPIFSITQSYSFPFSLKAQLKASYQGKMAYGQVAAHASSLINFSLQKTICNGNGTITLFANDIFDSQREKLTLIMKGKSAWCQTLNHNRLIGVGFSWKFVKGVDIKEKKHKNPIDEINRVYL